MLNKSNIEIFDSIDTTQIKLLREKRTNAKITKTKTTNATTIDSQIMIAKKTNANIIEFFFTFCQSLSFIYFVIFKNDFSFVDSQIANFDKTSSHFFAI